MKVPCYPWTRSVSYSTMFSESAHTSNASHSGSSGSSCLRSPSNTMEALANKNIWVSALILTERQFLESPPRRLGEHEVDEHDLERIPYTISNIAQVPVYVPNRNLTRCTISSLSRTHWTLSQLSKQRADGHTCDVNTDRIHKLVHKRRTTATPLEDGDTLGSNMEGEKFDQVGCWHLSLSSQRVRKAA